MQASLHASESAGQDSEATRGLRFIKIKITGRPCTRPVYTGVHTGVRFPLPELTARVDGCQKMHPSSRAVNSARELGP